MTTNLTRRIERLECALSPERSGPCFIMAANDVAAESEIARLKAAYGERLPRTLFVMICSGIESRGQ